MELIIDIKTQKDNITNNPILAVDCEEKDVLYYIDTMTIFENEIGKYKGTFEFKFSDCADNLKKAETKIRLFK